MSLIFMELILSFNHAFTHLFTPSLCTDKILLVTSKRNTAEAVLSRRNKIHWLMYLEKSKSYCLSTLGAYIVSPSLRLPSPFLLISSYFFSSSTSHLPILQSGSLLVASKEPPAALNKHLSNLATRGREIAYHWQEPKKPWGEL